MVPMEEHLAHWVLESKAVGIAVGAWTFLEMEALDDDM